MAILSPPHRPAGPSDAEAAVFDALAKLPDDWYVLHSLWLDTHNRKAHAEVDFVVIGPRAVLLLEVKGGQVYRDTAGWHFVTRSGRHVNTKPEGPFDQVRGAYYAMKQHLTRANRLDLFHGVVWGYGVVLPDCQLAISGHDPFVSEDLYLDIRGFPEEMRVFLDGLTAHWSEHKRERQGDRLAGIGDMIPSAIRKEIYSVLRPDFEVIRGRGAAARGAEGQILTLTQGQLDVLDQMAANSRVLLEGGAGTGKTVLAVEQAVRQASTGRRVLLTCFNRLLAEDIKRRTEDIPGLDVANYHQLLTSLLNRAGMELAIDAGWEEFNRQVEDFVVQVLDRIGNEFQPYEYLVMDEAQDLMTAPFLGAMELLLDGGFRNGRWTLCLDRDQAIFAANFDEAMLADVERNGAIATLTVNCRNTQEVAAHVTGLTDLGTACTRGTHGPDVGIDYYGDRREFLAIVRRETNRIIQEFADAGLPASEITLLAADTAAFPERLREPGFFLRPLSPVSEHHDNNVRMATVQSFKGLESAAVILLGTESISSPAGRKLLYVGGSRARSVLHLILPGDCDTLVQQSLARILALLR